MLSAADTDRFDGVIADVLDLPREAVTQELSALTCAEWDSANHLRLVFALEDAFDVRFSIDEIEAATSRSALLSLLAEKRAQD
jgi:acyl carrier protein